MNYFRETTDMTNEDVKKIVKDTPHMNLEQANRLTSFIQQHEIKDILELGFCNGVSTAYMAAALSRSGGGSIVTIDLEYVRSSPPPNIESLLE